MKFVVGFIGSDGTLGRTFLAIDDNEVRSALWQLHEENDDFFDEDNDWWESSCSLELVSGTYFVGGLETLDVLDTEEISK